MRLFNSHCHTHNSIDCAADPDEMCQAAVRSGVSGLAFCDHCHGGSFITYNTYDVLKKSHADATKMATKYQDCLQVFKGAEFDEILWTPDYIDRLIKSFQFDIILASVHRVKNAKDSNYISRVDFNKLTRDELCDFVSGYFDEVLKTAQLADFDALAHLTLILRYVTGKYKIEINLADYMPQIDKILQIIINREKALELNTSEMRNIGFMPTKEILKRYYSFGGRLVTIGTDSHIPHNIDFGILEGITALKDCGFDSYYYYKNRVAQREPIKE